MCWSRSDHDFAMGFPGKWTGKSMGNTMWMGFFMGFSGQKDLRHGD
jgi:hypothetical protein